MREIGYNLLNGQETNRSLVIRVLHKSGQMSRADISRLTGLTQATITKIIADLIEEELVVEVGLRDAGRGRRSIALEVNSNRYKVLAIKIERTNYSLGVFNLKGEKYTTIKRDCSEYSSAKEILHEIQKNAQELLNEYKEILAVGVAVPGPYLREEGKMSIITEASVWNHTNVKKEFSDMFSIPVFVEHDANAGAMADWWFGSISSEVDVLVHLLLSEGVGAGIIEKGSLHIGHQGIAGEIGHISLNMDGELCECGNRGCMELYCSAIALKKRALKKMPLYPSSSLNKYKRSELTYEDIFREMRNGDSLAEELVLETAKYIGCGIVNIVNGYNPKMILLSDIMTMGGEKMLDEIRRTVKKRILPDLYDNLTICYSDRSCDAVLKGAAAVATDHIFHNPGNFFDFP